MAGSSCSEPWSGLISSAHPGDDESLHGAFAPAASGSNVVLGKRTRKMAKDVKGHGDQLLGIRGDLRSCKAKIDAQAKQVGRQDKMLFLFPYVH